MPYFLKHYFDPYFDHQDLKPAQNTDGSVNHYDLSYVQNVRAFQVLAEWQEIDEQEADNYDPGFVFQEKSIEPGANCQINPDDSRQIIAAANGYVFYEQGRITVKTILNIRGNVDFHTGNIRFVGDLIVHNKVNSGFTIQANNIRIKGVVEGAQVSAGESLLVEQGVKGQDSALLRAEKKMRLRFAEKAILQAKRHVLIDGSCLHCHTYANDAVAVKAKMIGGNCYTQGQIYVGEQLGGGISTSTCLFLGKNPFLLLKAEQLEERIIALGQEIEEIKARAQNSEDVQNLQKNITKKEKQYLVLTQKMGIIWEKINKSKNFKSRVIVPGEVHPGVQIWIGPAHLKNEDYLQDVCFYLKDGEIKIQSPAPGL